MGSRTWINISFWIAWAIVGTVWLSLTWPQLFESRLSLCFAIAAVWLNFYPRFVQGPRLTCTVNQVTILGIVAGNQQSVLLDMAIKDLLADQPSTSARNIVHAALAPAVNAKDPVGVRAWFLEHPARLGLYTRPPDDVIRPFLGDPRTTPAFIIPHSLHNSGARHAAVACILMTAELTSDRNRRWAYAAYTEFDESKLVHIDPTGKDTDRIAGFFSGLVIAPNASAKLSLHFVPQREALGVTLSTTSLAPGTYDFTITGLNAKGRKQFSTTVTDYPLAEDTLLMSFKNGDWAYYPGVDKGLLKLLGKSH